MSSMQRRLGGGVLVHHLARDSQMIDEALLARSGRSARTLVKEGPLRITLMAVAAGEDVPPHHADGPVAIQVLRGDIVFRVPEGECPLAAGDMLVLPARVEHSARAVTDCAFLVTIVHAPGAGAREQHSGG